MKGQKIKVYTYTRVSTAMPIEGRLEFNRMMGDIKSGKDGVSFVLVFKLSRFGRNAADVLSALQVMQE